MYGKLYDEETGFYLNYLTLSISEPAIAREANLHLGQQYTRIFIPVVLILVSTYCLHLFQFFVEKSGHPVQLLSGSVNMVGLVLVSLMLKFKKLEYIHLMPAPYLMIHVISAVCIYKEWVPAAW